MCSVFDVIDVAGSSLPHYWAGTLSWDDSSLVMCSGLNIVVAVTGLSLPRYSTAEPVHYHEMTSGSDVDTPGTRRM